MNVFVAKKTKAKRLVAGLYADATGQIALPTADAWNAVPVPSTVVAAGQPY